MRHAKEAKNAMFSVKKGNLSKREREKRERERKKHSLLASVDAH